MSRAFFARDPLELAPELLNTVLTVDDPLAGGLAARIVEVEAYHGSVDPGSHAFRGRTARNAVMFGPPGHLYVYFTYGMHWCANVVADTPDDAGAVLLRAAVPIRGVETMRLRRPAARRDVDLCRGPANLCRAFGITGAANGADLCRGPIALVDDGTPPPERPLVTTRVGLGAGRGDELPWRFAVPGDPHVSRGPREPTG